MKEKNYDKEEVRINYRYRCGSASCCLFRICTVLQFAFLFWFHSKWSKQLRKTVDDVKRALSKATDDYSLTLEEADDQEEKISSKDAGLTISFKGGEVDELLDKQSPFKWISGIASKKKYTSKNIAEIDDGVLDDTLQSLDCVKNSDSGTQTADATYEFSDGKFQIKDEVYGTNIDMDAFTKNVKTALYEF